MNDLVWNTICETFPYGIYVWIDAAKLVEDHTVRFGDIFDDNDIRDGYIGKVDTIYSDGDILLEEFDYDEPPIPIEYCKPILRPLSDITKEEQIQINLIKGNLHVATTDNLLIPIINYSNELVNWLDSNHFDYRGLIKKDSAVSTKKYNPYEELPNL